MAGFTNQDLNLMFTTVVWENIKKTLITCSKAMKEESLSSSHLIDNNENKIRNRLVAKYLTNDEFKKRRGIEQFNLLFMPEVPENFDEESDTYLGRTDIRIVNIDFLKFRQEYYTIECKRVDGSNDLNKKYVTKGIARFVSDPILYPSDYGKNLMFGFVVKPIDINANSVSIEIIQQLELKDCIKKSLHMIDFEKSQFYLYSSEYNISQQRILELQHLFFDFSLIIKPLSITY